MLSFPDATLLLPRWVSRCYGVQYVPSTCSEIGPQEGPRRPAVCQSCCPVLRHDEPGRVCEGVRNIIGSRLLIHACMAMAVVAERASAVNHDGPWTVSWRLLVAAERGW